APHLSLHPFPTRRSSDLCHGNPLHPKTSIAREHHEVFEKTVALAERLGVDRVITFGGCPGAGPNATEPSWIVSPWPPEFGAGARSEEHTSELQSREKLVC